ncbi:unnamed protein product [Trichogramma brassicae]|uniref:Uncharacterized protein n=1 Tax=Trichogramma brassicae TaxID=86971 RepID=A0A6H5J8M6_9HYME|nr:unnamed protein product [Trichogramma brassicae]
MATRTLGANEANQERYQDGSNVNDVTKNLPRPRRSIQESESETDGGDAAKNNPISTCNNAGTLLIEDKGSETESVESDVESESDGQPSMIDIVEGKPSSAFRRAIVLVTMRNMKFNSRGWKRREIVNAVKRLQKDSQVPKRRFWARVSALPARLGFFPHTVRKKLGTCCIQNFYAIFQKGVFGHECAQKAGHVLHTKFYAIMLARSFTGDIFWKWSLTGIFEFNCPEIVRGFLEHGQDPNCIWPETGDSALHIALSFAWTNDIMILLLRAGANPNSANKKGLTPLHIIAKEDYDCEIIKLFFQINDELNQLVQINARDESGNTPIHLALKYFDEQELVEIMLRRGASPNSANDEGSTPLHIICKKGQFYIDDLTECFFKINEELNQRVQVDARDKLDRTPLQCAVVSCLPYAVESLLNRGADLSSFVFPTSSQFNDCFESDRYKCIQSKLRLALGFLAVIECLEKRGYELDRSDALIIMKLFDKYKLFDEMEDLNERWYDDKKFAKKARKKMVKPDLSLYDLIHLRPHDAVKRLTYMGCYDLVKPDEWWLNSLKTNLANEACCRYLCEMMSRKFFRSWALEPFWKLIHYRLPLECCEMVLENLQNKDLYHIFLAAEGRTDKDGKINVITNMIKCNNERPIRARKAPKKAKH